MTGTKADQTGLTLNGSSPDGGYRDPSSAEVFAASQPPSSVTQLGSSENVGEANRN